MFDANKILNDLVGGLGGGAAPTGGAPQRSAGGLGGLGGIAGGAAAGGLAGLLMGNKKARKFAGNAAMVGGLALVGGLAYKAYSNYSARKAGGAGAAAAPAAEIAPPPADGRFLPRPDDAADVQNRSRALVRAMIAAAKADGHIDATEQGRIFERLRELQLSAEDKAFVMDELASPLDPAAVAEGATSEEMAAEIYAASLLAIDANGAAERRYLDDLARTLRLDPALVFDLHAGAGV